MRADVLEDLKRAVIAYEAGQAASLAAKVVREGIDPLEALDAITVAIREVGDGFNRGILWLPDLIRAAEAFKAALPVLTDEITGRGARRESLGIVVIGTVYGDIHNIGKDMVATLLMADGFAVHDLGINVTVDQFIEAIRGQKADLLAMSALLTMSSAEQKKVIETLKKEGLRDKVKVMVGGGAISQEFADSIGADGYAATAPLATELARALLPK